MRAHTIVALVGLWLVPEVWAEEAPYSRTARPAAPAPPRPRPKPAAAPPVEAPAEAAPPPAPVCADGWRAGEDTAWNCCLPGQRWAQDRCAGVPTACPADQFVLGETCEPMPILREVSAAATTLGTVADRPVRGEPVAKIELAAYAIAPTEVTQGFYQRVMGDNPTVGCEGATTGDDLPVACVSWNDAVQFCNRLSALAGLDPAYRVDGGVVVWDRTADGFRLPTAAEWEHAARAEEPVTYAGSDRAQLVAWYAENSEGKARPVGGLRPNAWGLYDMSGNVAEWAWDAVPRGRDKDAPPPWDTGDVRVLRGGGFNADLTALRAARPAAARRDQIQSDAGFRLARSPRTRRVARSDSPTP